MTEVKREKINFRRFLTLFGIVLVTFFFSGFLCLYENLYTDEIYCLIFIDILFLFMFIFELEFSRSQKQLAENRNTYFLNVFIGYTVCCILAAGFAFLPVYAKPVMMISIIAFSIANELVSFVMSCYLVIMLGITVSSDYYELLSKLFLIILGVILVQCTKNIKLRILVYIPVICTNIIIPVVFYYMEYKKAGIKSILYGLICALFSVLTLFICRRYVIPHREKEKINLLYDLISEDYPLVRDIRNDKSNEFIHANRVSTITYECAVACGLNPEISTVAGFYYRLGKWLGEPEIENSISKAQELCFPEDIITILGEYYGQERKPSTPESALVHMVDGLVKKLEKMDGEVDKSSWNNEMIIYQTLNEFSSSGIYDESGLSMNHFLKIREFLAKERII